MNLWCEIKLLPGCPRDAVYWRRHYKAAHYRSVVWNFNKAATFAMLVSVFSCTILHFLRPCLHWRVFPTNIAAKSHILTFNVLPGVFIYWGEKNWTEKISSKRSKKIWNCKNKDFNIKKTNENTSNIIISKVQTYNWLQYHPFFFPSAKLMKLLARVDSCCQAMPTHLIAL